MKILLLENLCLAVAFKELGHDVVTFSTHGGGDIKIATVPIRIGEVLSRLPINWKPDIIMLIDASGIPTILELEAVGIPLAWYVIDSHIHVSWHKAYAAVFDFIFLAQKDFIPHYVHDSSRQVVSWLPLFAPYVPPSAPPTLKTHSLSFVGTLSSLNPERVHFIQAIQQRFPFHLEKGEWVKVFQNSKMVLNQCMANDVNFRTFEAMGSGSCLLMERVSNGLQDLFQDRTHCVMYEKGNVEEILDLVNYYEAHEDEREAIAHSGRSEVLRAHRGIHRARTILQTVRSGPVQEMVSRRKRSLNEIRMFLKHVYAYAAAKHEDCALQLSIDTEKSQGHAVSREIYTLLSNQT